MSSLYFGFIAWEQLPCALWGLQSKQPARELLFLCRLKLAISSVYQIVNVHTFTIV